MLDYNQITKGDLRSAGDRRMARLMRKVKNEEEIHAAVQARRMKNKTPSSLTMKQENEARVRFNANRLTKPVNDELRAVIDLVNVDSNGRYNADIYTRYRKKIKLEEEGKKLAN